MTRCTTCNHPDRAQIEIGLANRVSLRTLQARHGLSKEALCRHRKAHMPPQLIAQLVSRGRTSAEDLEQLRVTESEGLLSHLIAQRGRLYALADGAEQIGDTSAAAKVHGQLSRNLELTGKLLGDLRTGSQTVTQNLVVLPEYHHLRVALVQALAKFPEARQAVTAALQRMEASSPPPPAIEHAPARVSE